MKWKFISYPIIDDQWNPRYDIERATTYRLSPVEHYLPLSASAFWLHPKVLTATLLNTLIVSPPLAVGYLIIGAALALAFNTNFHNHIAFIESHYIFVAFVVLMTSYSLSLDEESITIMSIQASHERGLSVGFVIERKGLICDKNAFTNNTRQLTQDSIGKNGFTKLMWAAAEGIIKDCEFYIDTGIDVNSQDKRGATALMYAARNGHLAVVQLLINSGADKTIATTSGHTASHFAYNSGHLAIVDLLNRHGQ